MVLGTAKKVDLNKFLKYGSGSHCNASIEIMYDNDESSCSRQIVGRNFSFNIIFHFILISFNCACFLAEIIAGFKQTAGKFKFQHNLCSPIDL